MNPANYDDFKDECVSDIHSLQEAFINLYDLNSYENWYYDHGTGAFHFSSEDGRNLYFEYVDVGSYSTKTNTWMWSWNNPTTPKHVSRRLGKVIAYGEENGYDDLTQGLLENGDDYTGWALTSITAKLVNAIGAYRVPHEHLFIYFVFTNELTQEEFDNLKDRYVECDEHGTERVAFVCQHLLSGNNLGFHEAVDSDEAAEHDEDYQAWCDACEATVQKEGEWNETAIAFSNIKLVCDQCYFDIKNNNQITGSHD